MTFKLEPTAVGECPICLEDFNYDAVSHDKGEQHPIHLKCLQVWKKNQKKLNQVPTCPGCRCKIISIDAIKITNEALFRMAEIGNLQGSKVLLQQHRFLLPDLPLISASANGHHEVVEELLKRGDIHNCSRGCALEAASEKGHVKVVNCLLEAPRTLHQRIPDESIKKSIQKAKENGHEEVVKILEPLDAINDLFRNSGKIRRENGLIFRIDESLTLD